MAVYLKFSWRSFCAFSDITLLSCQDSFLFESTRVYISAYATRMIHLYDEPFVI